MTPPKPCRHCRRATAHRPRGLCWVCYYTPAVRALYPPTPAKESGAMGGRKRWAAVREGK